MTIREVLKFLNIFLLIVSILLFCYSILNKNKKVCKYLRNISIVNIVYALLDTAIIPNYLHIDYAMGMLIYYFNSILIGIFSITTIIIVVVRQRKLEEMNVSKGIKCMNYFLLLFPVILIIISFLIEMFYISNARLILRCSGGTSFNDEDYIISINDNYVKKLSIGSDFNGFKQKMLFPDSFKRVNYFSSLDSIKIENDKIIVTVDDEVIYTGKYSETYLVCNDPESVLYK